MSELHPDHDLPEIVKNRSVAYEALFQGELPYEPQPNEADIGLSGLWRAYTEKRGGTAHDLETILDTTPKIVEKALKDHQREATSGNSQAEAIFGLINPGRDLPVLNSIVTQTMKIWEKALYKNAHPRLLHINTDIDQSIETHTPLNSDQEERLAHLLTNRSLIVEVAAATLEALPEYSNKPLTPSKQEQQDTAKLLANWGPKFVREWMRGDILRRWLDSQELSEAEKHDWLDIFTPSLRKRFAVRNINDPLKALERMKHNLEVVLTDAAIAERLGWSEEEVREIFTPSLRKRFAVRNINDPLQGIQDYVAGKISYGGKYFKGAK